jgi:hypothetical protein
MSMKKTLDWLPALLRKKQFFKTKILNFFLFGDLLYFLYQDAGQWQ